MVFNWDQFSLDMWWNFALSSDRVEHRDIIIDRKSKYSVVAIKVTDIKDVKIKFKELISDPYFRKASHNSYSYRIVQENGSIIEWKNDDGEQWAGMCILRELQREDATGIMLVVTRYFWGIQLYADRFKNVIDACKLFFEKEKK
jgi:putative IMPACT (imprinted ancient) family translation regulator